MGSLSPHEQTLEELKRMRLIFTLTPGRSGTRFLATVLNLIPDVTARHEPEPGFQQIMRAVQRHPQQARRFWIERKFPELIEEQQPIYAETSHVAAKGFLKPLLDWGLLPDLIRLRRPHREVAQSHFELGFIPARTQIGLYYYLSPEDPNVLRLPGWRNLHDYQLCYWYCLEMERRADRQAHLFRNRGGRVVETSLSEVRLARGFDRLIEELGLERPRGASWNRFLKLKHRKIHGRQLREDRNQPPPASRLRELEQEVEQRVEPPDQSAFDPAVDKPIDGHQN